MKNSVVQKNEHPAGDISEQELDSLKILANVFVSQFKRYKEDGLGATVFSGTTPQSAMEKSEVF